MGVTVPPDHLNDLFPTLLSGGVLSESQAEDVFERLLGGRLDEGQIGALLALIATRGPSVDELVGAARVMRRYVAGVRPPVGRGRVVDTCGTGGAPKLFNVSTLGAIVTAAAAPGRVLVAKHGNKSRTGRGSAELMQALGVRVDASADVQERCLREIGVCFSYAPSHHPAARHAAGVRKSLGFPTIFNIIGPLANPAGATRQLVGTYSVENARKLAAALARLGAERAMVIHSIDGLDELTTTAVNMVWHVEHRSVREDRLDARELGFAPARVEDLLADSLEDAVGIARAVLAGEAGPRRDLVELNAGASLYIAGCCVSVAEGVLEARRAIGSGAAERTLGELIRLSNGS